MAAYAFMMFDIPVWYWPRRPIPHQDYVGTWRGFTVVDLHIEFWTGFDEPANDMPGR